MREAKKWLRENSFWKIFITYSVGSWVVLGHVDLLTERFGVPNWVFKLSLSVSLLGLAGVLFVAFALKKKIRLRRLIAVILGYWVIGESLLLVMELVGPHLPFPNWVLTTASISILLLLPVAMALTLLWPLRKESGAEEGDGIRVEVPS